MGGQFESKGKDQNVGQGDGAVGKQVNDNRSTTQTIEGNENITAGRDVNITNNNYPTAPPVIPRQLPSLDDCFLGRDKDLADLIDQLHPGKVAAVCGPGGMGKSALAAQAVHKLEKDRFPDGIVFHSFYGHPETEQALQTICAAFQVEAKAGLETTVKGLLANKKALLILDGAEEADDLKAVLDLRSTCGVLITSRKRDDALSFRLDLVPLEKKPAAEVLREHSGLAADDIAVQGICEILDGWPVGLRIAGRYLGSRGERAADYLRWLKKRPFRKLSTGGHQEDNAALLLERSVEQVSVDAVQALRLAGVLAFASISLMPFSLALYTEDENTDELELRSNDALGELVRYGLFETTEKGWKISHALIHTYARTELALSRESLERLAKYYIWFCKEQSKAGLPGYALLDGERTHCLRLIAACLESGLWQGVKGLVGAISTYLDRQGWWTEKLAALKMNLTAARQTKDQWGEAWCLNSLGYTCKRRGDLDNALIWYKQSLPIFQQLGERKGEGAVLNNIAMVYQQQDKYELALQICQQSLSIWQEVGTREGEGAALNNIGLLYMYQDEWDTASTYLEQALPIRQEAGDEIGVGQTLNNIAEIYRAQGNPSKAMEYHEQALTIRKEQGDRAGEAESCWQISRSYEDLGDLTKTEEYMVLAVQIKEAIGTPDAEECRDGLEQVRAERRRA